MPKSGDLVSHAPFGGILNKQCLSHHGGGWVGWWGWVVGSSWWWSCVWHASVCCIPGGRDTPICVKTLCLRFLKAPVTSKLETAEATEYVNFRCYQAMFGGRGFHAFTSVPLAQNGQNSCIQVNFSLSQSVVSAFLVHFFTLLDLFTIVDHVSGSVSLIDPPLHLRWKQVSISLARWKACAHILK